MREDLVKIPKANLHSRRAIYLNRACGRPDCTYPYTKEVNVVTYISYKHHGVALPVTPANPAAISSCDISAAAPPDASSAILSSDVSAALPGAPPAIITSDFASSAPTAPTPF